VGLGLCAGLSGLVLDVPQQEGATGGMAPGPRDAFGDDVGTVRSGFGVGVGVGDGLGEGDGDGPTWLPR